VNTQSGSSHQLQIQLRGGLISLWLYKENNKLRDWKNVFTVHTPPWSPHTYELFVLTSLTHPRKFFWLCCKQKNRKWEKPKTYQHPYVPVIFCLSVAYLCSPSPRPVSGQYPLLRHIVFPPRLRSSLFTNHIVIPFYVIWDAENASKHIIKQHRSRVGCPRYVQYESLCLSVLFAGAGGVNPATLGLTCSERMILNFSLCSVWSLDLLGTSFMLVSCLAKFLTLKMTATGFSETSIEGVKLHNLKYSSICLSIHHETKLGCQPCSVSRRPQYTNHYHLSGVWCILHPLGVRVFLCLREMCVVENS
jgi:hypothetical protein